MTMPTDTQLIVLSGSGREDAAAIVPQKINKAAAAKIGSRLIGRKLMREIRSKFGMPVWRADEDSRSMSLVVTRAGRDAISIDEPDVTYQPVSSKSSDSQRADRHHAGAAPRPGSKQARRRDAVQAGAVLSVAMLHDPLTPVLAAAAILMGIGV
jgi:hypothetical protein